MNCGPTAAFEAGLWQETQFRRFWPGSESTYSELLTRDLCAIIGAIQRILPDLRLTHRATAGSLGRQPGSVRHAMDYPCLGVDGRGHGDLAAVRGSLRRRERLKTVQLWEQVCGVTSR